MVDESDAENPAQPDNGVEVENPVVTETVADSENAEISESSQGSLTEGLNFAPQITDTSYQCDPVTEAVAYSIGDSEFFTLSVEDESPLTLSYDSNSSNEVVASVSVDDNGVFKVLR